ncbi:MAG: DNA polymerase III subunit beta [Gracilibacteraceae bacterium]|jgi:DNA polymerase-3 subunit beta|nr:DNA polymerase III subunit beta [Gracilibacteraceae bacterium]
MIALCTKEDLLDGVGKVQKAVSARNTLPVLQGIKISAGGGELLFEATDLELGIRCRVPVNVQEEGVMVLPAALLTELTRRLPEGAVRLEQIENTLHIFYGEANFQINGFDADEFPEFGNMDLEKNFTLDGLQLKQMIRQTIYARAITEDSRAVFSGVLMEKKGGEIRMVCTDTHRLTYVFLPLGEGGSDFRGIIPGKTTVEIQRLLDDDPVNVSFDQAKMIFKFKNLDIMTRLIVGQYPNYESVIPKTCHMKARINTRQLASVVERAALLSRDNSMKMAFVRFKIEGDVLTIDQNNESGSIYEKIEIEQEGDDLQLSFNARYLLDMVKVIDTEHLIMETGGSANASVFRPDGAENYISLVLPMRL